MVNELADIYLKHYQSGGGMPVFVGKDYQYGNGIGDILKSVGRFLLPIFSGLASSFVSNTAEGISRGQSLKDSAKFAIAPAINESVGRLTSSLQNKLQSGTGIRRKRKNTVATKFRKRVYKSKKPRGLTKFNTKPKIKFNF